MQQNNNLILEEVSKISIKLLLNDPFYGHFFTGLVKEITDTVPTMAVSLQNDIVKLYVNPKFWVEHLITEEYRVGVLKHEILHIVLKHIFRFSDFSRHDIYNVSADLVVNQLINPTHLPDSAVKLSLFPYLQLEENQSVDYYYQKLFEFKQKMQEIERVEDGEEQQSCDEGGPSGSGNPSGNQEEGEGCGQDQQGEGNADQDQQGTSSSQKETWDNLKKLIQPDGMYQLQHKFWKEFSKLTKSEKDIFGQNIDQILTNTLDRIKIDQYGNLPGFLQDYLNKFQQSMKPQLDWRRLLRIFTTSSQKSYLKNTLRRPSKRYGTTPGIKIRHRNKILVAIDTSGSVVQEELIAFFSELFHIWRQGAEIYIVECDTAISARYKYRGRPPQKVTGRGGTSFDEPVKFANEVYNPDALVYFTDGHAPPPIYKSRCPIMWLISKEGAQIKDMEAFQGRIVKMT